MINATITTGLVELSGAIFKSAAESFLLLLYLWAAAENHSRHLPGLRREFKEMDKRLEAFGETGKTFATSGRRRTLFYFWYSLAGVSFSTFAGAKEGLWRRREP